MIFYVTEMFADFVLYTVGCTLKVAQVHLKCQSLQTENNTKL